MPIDLSSYTSVETGLFVRIEVDYYKAAAGDTPTSTVLRFSDYRGTVTINSESYVGLGKLLNITSTTSELKGSTSSVTVSISGIPDSSIAEIINSRMKGCPIKIYRVVFDPVTGTQLAITGNPAGRFFGIVSNYSLEEDYNIDERTSTNTISLICSSNMGFLENKISGRKTNPESMKRFYPTDVSMDRVPNLVGANFNFGAPK
jgi:hypothetical protein